MTGQEHEPRAQAGLVTVVGMGADGWAGLGEAARLLILDAPLVIAGHRLQALLPDIPGQDRRPWPSPMLPGLPMLLEEYRGRDVLVVASGDPLVSGVGTTLIEKLGRAHVRVIPAVSSVALARARMGWSAESTEVVSVVGRDVHAVLAPVAPGRRLIVLSADERTPLEVAGLLVGAGYGPSRLTVLGDLGTAAESSVCGTAAAWDDLPCPRLNLVCVDLIAEPGATVRAGLAGLPDEAFEHDGQLTKRDVRASALARLAPVPGQLLWDVGAGAGSIAIEWARTHPRCAAVAVERDPVRAERIGRNARSLGVPRLRVVRGSAPSALADLPAPDAVFIGGGAGGAGVIQSCWQALGPAGRLVVHAVTLETESILVGHYRTLGGELVRLSVERAAPVGSFTGWVPGRAVVQWSVTKNANDPR